ncbi:mucin TcMUCII, putative [Trypanosoma cruzi]|nr:mucin TcMUCII, putative [Trypanosoma cruzi]
MMTCRLLCALLVLALCCCSSVCAAATGDVKPSSLSSSPSEPQVKTKPDVRQDSAPEAPVISDKDTTPGGRADAGQSPSPREAVSQVTAASGPPSNALGAEPGKVGGGGSESKDTSDVLQGEDIDDTEGRKSEKNAFAHQTDQEVEDPAKTTTKTTTKAPITTTTTAPEAPSTTTTEAPTTTTELTTTMTTRAPSLLREVDGSLSSSAWVCFPLLLAVSALAYTAVG